MKLIAAIFSDLDSAEDDPAAGSISAHVQSNSTLPTTQADIRQRKGFDLVLIQSYYYTLPLM